MLATSINTVIVVPVTSNLGQRDFPGNVVVPAGMSGLEIDSVALVSQLGPVSREFVEPYRVGQLSRPVWDELTTGIRLVIGL